jgi:hypothetical protein
MMPEATIPRNDELVSFPDAILLSELAVIIMFGN